MSTKALINEYRTDVVDAVACPACGSERGYECVHINTGEVVNYVHDDRSAAHVAAVRADERAKTASEIAVKIEQWYACPNLAPVDPERERRIQKVAGKCAAIARSVAAGLSGTDTPTEDGE